MKTGEQNIHEEMKTADAMSTVTFLLPGIDREKAWAFIADTDGINRVLGAPLLDVAYDKNTPGGSVRTMTTRDKEKLEYDEEFYQWGEYKWVGIRRKFHSGPFAKLVYLFHLEEGDELSLLMTSAGWASSKESRSILTDYIENQTPKHLKNLESHLEKGRKLEIPGYEIPEVDISKKIVEAARTALLTLGDSNSTINCFIEEISKAPDYELAQMSPLELAERWHENRNNVISTFLLAARLNIVSPVWSVICPSCRGPKSEGTDIGVMPREVHCKDCNIDFSSNPQENIQLTFTPTESFRPIEPIIFCMAGPSRTSHIKSQVFVNPDESVTILEHPEKYSDKQILLRCPAIGKTQIISKEGSLWILDNDGFHHRESIGDVISVKSNLDERVRVVVEEKARDKNVLLAHEVLEKPIFRKLFAADQWEFLGAMDAAWKEEFDANISIPEPLQKEFDLIVIGSGPAGESAAARAAKYGARVAIVESRKTFGGPTGLTSKAFRESASKVLQWASSSSETKGNKSLHSLFNQRFSEFRRYIKMIVASEIKTRLGAAGITLVHGQGAIQSNNSVLVSRLEKNQSFTLQASHIVLATGSRPNRPEDIPFDGKHILDASEFGEIDVLPRKVCIIGGGIIGCEYASILIRLNVEVILIHRSGQLLSFLDSDLSLEFIEDLKSHGVQIITNAKYESVKLIDNNLSVGVKLDTEDTIDCDLLLYVEGREGASSELLAENMGIEPTRRGYFTVNENCETKVPSLFAIGDLTGPPGLASMGVRQGRDVSDFIFGKGKEKKQEIPTCLWTMPEIATVGKTKDSFREMNIEPLCGRAFHKNTARGAINNTLTGWLELIALPENGQLVGVQAIGEQACELIHYGAALIQAKAKINDIANAGYAAVTYHDLYHQAAEAALSKNIVPESS